MPPRPGATAPTHDSSEAILLPEVPQELVELIRSWRAPVVIAHVVPDADALGAMLTMATALSSGDCKPKVSLPDGSLSQKLTFMLDSAAPPVANEDDFTAADGFLVLDTAKKSRCNVGPALAETDWSANRPIGNIDHHETNTRFGDVNWVVEPSGSTCELVYYLLRRAEVPISPRMASWLYAGIQTDTLGFSLPTTNAWALKAAAHLVVLGADVAQLGERLCRSQRQSEFELLRIVYDNTKTLADGRLAYSTAGYDEIHNAGCTAADIDDQISIPRSLDGAELAMLFSEGHKGHTRVNFRGAGSVTVVELAAEFGGGGHSQ
ncbi:MAG: DHH family phosphoesterase, partial [Phycisphaerae bacterium]